MTAIVLAVTLRIASSTPPFSSATLSFNLAVLVEDLGREAEAVIAYREALALDPDLHDAHFNLSRLHESASRPQEALWHLLAYRRRVRHEVD